MIFLILIFSLSIGQQTVLVNQAGTSSSCSTTPVYWDFTSPGPCFPTPCNCNTGNTSCTVATCNTVFGTAFPNPPAGLTLGGIFFKPSGGSTQCNTIDTYSKVFFTSTACQRLNGYSAIACCRNGSMVWSRWGSSDCSVGFQSSQTINAGGCVPFSGGGYALTSCPAGGPDTCPPIIVPTTSPAGGIASSLTVPIFLVFALTFMAF